MTERVVVIQGHGQQRLTAKEMAELAENMASSLMEETLPIQIDPSYFSPLPHFGIQVPLVSQREQEMIDKNRYSQNTGRKNFNKPILRRRG